MSLFALLTKLTHPSEKKGWVEIRAYFTGKVEKAASGRPGHYGPAEYNEYQIRYYTKNKEMLGWYAFYPLPDPDPEEIAGTEITIRYKENRPWLFEAVDKS